MLNNKCYLDFTAHNKAYLEIPHHPALGITGDLTIEFWFYLRQWPAGWTAIISKFSSDQHNEFCFRLKDEKIGQWYYGDGKQAVKPVHWVPEEDLNLNRWTHLACVRKIGDYGRIYINGELYQQRDYSGCKEAVNTDSNLLVMGNPARYIDGAICDLRLWNYARQAEDINAAADKKLLGTEEGLIGYWKLEEGQGLLALDSARGNHGTIHNGQWAAIDSPLNLAVAKKGERARKPTPLLGSSKNYDHYQSLGDVDGASQSAQKLRALKLPESLQGKSVLDIGCAEGYFCRAAKKLGAAKVIGLDSDLKKLKLARQLDPHSTYLHQGWDNLPAEKFDLILHMSALHYAQKPRQLFKDIHSRLTEQGLLVLECGMINQQSYELVRVKRAKDVRYFPTRAMLFNKYLSDFAVKLVGLSVMQEGDPVTRYVFHCRKHKPIVLLVRGKGDVGKTVLSSELVKTGCQLIRTDGIMHEIAAEKKTELALENFVRAKYNEHNGSILKIVDELEADLKLIEELVEVIFQHISLEERMVLIEGYSLTDQVVKGLTAKLKDVALVWEVNRAFY